MVNGGAALSRVDPTALRGLATQRVVHLRVGEVMAKPRYGCKSN